MKVIDKGLQLLGLTRKSFDSWINYGTNLGTNSSRTTATRVGGDSTLSITELESIFRSNGLGRKIVSALVEDSLRAFIETDFDLLKELSRIKCKQKLLEAGIFGRLYGGSLLVAFLDDGLQMDQPVNFNRINQVSSLMVLNRYQVYYNNTDLNTDILSPDFGLPQFYHFFMGNTNIPNSEVLRIHRSRCFILGGDLPASRFKAYNQGWDASVLQSAYEALRSYGIVSSSSTEIIHDFVQVIFKMQGLDHKMSAQNGGAMIQERIRSLDITRSVMNGVVLDAEKEDYEKKSSSIAGLAELWDRFSEQLCAVTGYPSTKLFGRSPAGMNSTGQSDMQNYHDIINSYRSDQLQPAIDWIIEMVKVQKTWKGKKPSVFDWQFTSLMTPSDIDTAKIKKEYAEIDWGYIDRGAIDASEAWQERFGQEKFNINIKLSEPSKDDNEDLVDSIDYAQVIMEEDIQKEKIKKITEDLYQKATKRQ